MAGPIDVAVGVSAAMDQAFTALRASTKDALMEAGKVAKVELLATATLVPGPDRRFSRGGAAGKLDVKLRVVPGVVFVIPRGLWGVAEEGAGAHLAYAWGHAFQHPGTSQGRLAWSRGREAAFDRLGIEVPERIGADVETAFGRG